MAENSDIPQAQRVLHRWHVWLSNAGRWPRRGLYFDDAGNFYPQFYWGTPKLGISSGYATDLNEYLTGPSASITLGGAPLAVSCRRKYDIRRPGNQHSRDRIHIRVRTLSHTRYSSYIAKLPTLLYPRGPFQETYPIP